MLARPRDALGRAWRLPSSVPTLLNAAGPDADRPLPGAPGPPPRSRTRKASTAAMGAKPQPAAAVAAIGPEKVAHEFTSVYYKVASKQPSKLAQLYGVDSEVSHAAGENLVGLPGIAAGATALPLANKPVATVVSLDAMSSGAGAVVFVVAGALEGAPFTQTFVLSRADGDKVGHFYCRNDIFRFIPAAAQVAPAAPEPALAAAGAEAAQVAGAGAAAGDGAGKAPKAAASAAGGDASALNGHAAAAGEESDGYDSEEDGEEDDESETDEEEAVASGAEGAAANGAAVKGEETSSAVPAPAPSKGAAASPPAATSAAAGAPVVEDPAKKAADGASGKAATASTVGKTDGGSSGATVPAAKPSVSAKPKPKTWASIVSTTSGGSAVAPSASSAPAPAPAVSAGANAGTSATTKAGEATGAKPDASSTGPSYNTTAKAPYAGGHSGSHHHQNNHHNQHQKSNDTSGGGGWSSVDNKRQSNSHHGHQGHDGGFQKVMPSGQYGHNSGFKHHQGRVYGPSAVIQLNTLPADRAKDWRTLQQEFLDEFNSYGFPVRNVEVKTHKGLAFIEYQDQAGVRAAVAEWADGPRDKGNFKGIPLSVSEKRQRRPHMPGDGGLPGRGGRGGMRGGRGGGRGRGRGMPYSSNGGTGAHTTSAPAPATSSF